MVGVKSAFSLRAFIFMVLESVAKKNRLASLDVKSQHTFLVVWKLCWVSTQFISWKFFRQCYWLWKQLFMNTRLKKSVIRHSKSMFHLWGFLFNLSIGSKCFSFHVSIFLLIGLPSKKNISTRKLKKLLANWKVLSINHPKGWKIPFRVWKKGPKVTKAETSKIFCYIQGNGHSFFRIRLYFF